MAESEHLSQGSSQSSGQRSGQRSAEKGAWPEDPLDAAGATSQAELVVRALCEGVGKKDVEILRPLLADGVVYHNIPLEPAVGLEATLEALQVFFGMFERIEIKILAIATVDGTVLTERDDVMCLNGVEGHLPVMGAFEVDGGRITAWRDYFDMGQVTSILQGG